MDCSHLSHQELVGSCIAGDEFAWQEFIRRYNSLIACIVRNTARSWQDVSFATCEDLVQNVYVKLCEEEKKLLCGLESTEGDRFRLLRCLLCVAFTITSRPPARINKRAPDAPLESLSSVKRAW